MPASPARPKPVVLLILDGWGLSDSIEGNAVLQAQTPHFDSIWSECPRTRLAASGRDVGLQPGVMGNSEVGHLNIGAGRVVWQDVVRIDQTVKKGEFGNNDVIKKVLESSKNGNGRLHLCGLVSHGGVVSTLCLRRRQHEDANQL